MPGAGVVTPRLAASVIVLRRADPFEVLVVKRRRGGTFGDLVVFPGGTVDPDDRAHAGDTDDLPLRVAALRELAEETGLLALSGRTVPANGRLGPSLLRDVIESGDSLSTESLTLISRWVTPISMPYRFDTWFYLLVLESAPTVTVDGVEMIGHAWTSPQAALERVRAGEWQMILPTLSHLRWLEHRSSVEEVIASASGADGRTLITPVVMEDGSLVPVHLPAEVGGP